MITEALQEFILIVILMDSSFSYIPHYLFFQFLNILLETGIYPYVYCHAVRYICMYYDFFYSQEASLGISLSTHLTCHSEPPPYWWQSSGESSEMSAH